MKIDNQDIIRTARQLRDEQNQEQNVRQWHRHRHFQVPAWLVAIPAATIIGFILGLWTQPRMQTDEPLTALIDTVYIKIHETGSRQDSAAKTVPTVINPAREHVLRPSTKSRRKQQATGRPVADDHIRYDLLARD